MAAGTSRPSSWEGGSPCQGNSVLNTNRGGLRDERSWQPLHLRRLCDDLRAMAPEVPLFEFLENVASAPQDVIHEYSSLMSTSPLAFDAADWGYVRRRRLFWLHGPKGGPVANDFVVPEGFQVDLTAVPVEVRKVDSRPWPPQVRFGGGYHLLFDPKEVCRGGAEPLHTFTREFMHPRTACTR